MEAKRHGRHLRDLSARAWGGLLVRAVRGTLCDDVGNAAATLAYYGFLAIPSALLVDSSLTRLTTGGGGGNARAQPHPRAP